MKYLSFEQSAIAPYLELIKAQHSWISWPMVKCLLWWLFTLDYCNETKVMWAISKCWVEYFEQHAMNVHLDLFKTQHSWVLWPITSEVFAPITICSGLQNKLIYWAMSKCGVECFVKCTMHLHLELTKAQHSWILWVLAMWLLQLLLLLQKENSWALSVETWWTLRQGWQNEFGCLVRWISCGYLWIRMNGHSQH